MIYPSLFDRFLAPPTIVVVSEAYSFTERLKDAELKAKEKQLLQVKVQLEQLEEFYSQLEKEIKALKPTEEVSKDV